MHVIFALRAYHTRIYYIIISNGEHSKIMLCNSRIMMFLLNSEFKHLLPYLRRSIFWRSSKSLSVKYSFILFKFNNKCLTVKFNSNITIWKLRNVILLCCLLDRRKQQIQMWRSSLNIILYFNYLFIRYMLFIIN